MPEFLIDVNLPYRFKLWSGEAYIHQRDINDEWTDEQIWEYALERNLTIISKDSDFHDKMLLHEPPPRVIHIKFGNLKMKPFHGVLSRLWKEVLIMNQSHKLVNIYIDRIEGIS